MDPVTIAGLAGAGASLVGGLMFQFTHPVWGATSDGADDCRRYARKG